MENLKECGFGLDNILNHNINEEMLEDLMNPNLMEESSDDEEEEGEEKKEEKIQKEKQKNVAVEKHVNLFFLFQILKVVYFLKLLSLTSNTDLRSF